MDRDIRLARALARFPRAHLLLGPTPIEPAPRLGTAIGCELLVKRDDLTGLAFGGNKVRQLEFYFGAAQAEGADTVLITGAVQSNYVRVAAAAAAKLGMAAHVQLEERVPDVDETHRRSGNVLLDDLLGAVRHSFPVGEDEAGADAAVRAIADRLRGEGRRPYVIPLGPGHPPLGALGYVLAAREILDQVPHVDAIVVASGSGMTHGGLLFGLRALGDRTPVHGICVRRPASAQAPRIAARGTEIADMLEMAPCVGNDDVRVDDAALGAGYGRLDAPVFDAVSLAARTEGLFVDPVYTGKTLAGLIGLVRDGTIAQGARVLFIHTGGTPALFAYETQLRERLETTTVPRGR